MRRESRRWGRVGQAALRGALALSIAAVLAGPSPRQAWAAERAQATAPAHARAISATALERDHGIRITQVAVTGGGGLVDLRFTVLDPTKARPLLQDHARPPRLMAEGSDAELQPPTHGAMRNVRLQKDAACFLLYPNARSAIHAGTRVAVAFGDVRVEPVVAK